uniref:Uncharacterized protein n=1 Tax=Arundo donax TaxID=35708 RepID=A0A0A8XZR6_ARUDO
MDESCCTTSLQTSSWLVLQVWGKMGSEPSMCSYCAITCS